MSFRSPTSSITFTSVSSFLVDFIFSKHAHIMLKLWLHNKLIWFNSSDYSAFFSKGVVNACLYHSKREISRICLPDLLRYFRSRFTILYQLFDTTCPLHSRTCVIKLAVPLQFHATLTSYRKGKTRISSQNQCHAQKHSTVKNSPNAITQMVADTFSFGRATGAAS